MDVFRCIHASRLLLDHQLHVAGNFEPRVQKLVEEATLTAFDRVIDEALVHEANCLLLSGDCFDPADRSLRGPAALVRGLTRLAENDTPVVLHASPRLSSNWPEGLRLPPNVHRLGFGFESSISISRAGQLLATVSREGSGDDAGGWRVGLAGPAGANRTFSIADDHASVQGIRAEETGLHGCTVLEFDFESATCPQRSFIPVAPVRWERYSLTVIAATAHDDLVQEMATRLEQSPRCAGEQVRLVTWIVAGHGPLMDRLVRPGVRANLLDDLAQLEPLPGIAVHTHAFRLHPAGGEPIPSNDEPANDFALRLDERFARPAAALHECLAGSGLHGGPWGVKIESLFGELDAGELAHDARRLAMHWFAAEEELSS
ncbi:MAG: hypothetical protein HY290_14995 [Planctomycetia bacterium]|nr:hypothetical protein [Planctomycetia bacterium]